MKPARTETFEHAIASLLTKRQDMLAEAAFLREKQAVLANDLDALERTLAALGYTGALSYDEKQPRVTLFYRGELREFVLRTLKDGPQTTRQLSEALLNIEGRNPSDSRLLADVTRRIGKSLRLMQTSGFVQRRKMPEDKHFVWYLAEDDPGGWE
jgi:hypothetical protein